MSEAQNIDKLANELLNDPETARNYVHELRDAHAESIAWRSKKIAALESENAELRRKVEAAEALNKEVRAIASQTVVARTFGDWKYVTLEFWQHTVKRLTAAEDAYRRATATDEGG